MKCWAIFLLLVVWARRGEAVRCNEAASCAQGLLGSNVDDDKAAACRSMHRTIQCLKEAVEDCRSTQNVPDSALDAMNSQISHVEDLFYQQCRGNEHGGQMSRGVSDVKSSVIVLFVVILLAAIFP